MLKIKDNVDLKILVDKYGFEGGDTKYWYNIKDNYSPSENEWENIYLEVAFREITIKVIFEKHLDDYSKSHIDEIYYDVDIAIPVLFDLIRDGLVEKVEE